MDALFENFTVSILKLNKLVHKIKLYEMKEYGLQAVHVMCIYYISRSADGITAGELARLTLEDKAAISRAVALLLRKGYVSCDGRRYNSVIKITEAGQKVSDYIDRKAERAVNAGMDGTLTDERRDEFYKSLALISQNLKTYYDTLLKERAEKSAAQNTKQGDNR